MKRKGLEGGKGGARKEMTMKKRKGVRAKKMPKIYMQRKRLNNGYDTMRQEVTATGKRKNKEKRERRTK